MAPSMSVPEVNQPLVVKVIAERDVVVARNLTRKVASELAFSSTELTLISTAISEIARNIAVYAPPGRITIALVEREGRRGVRIVASDDGPGIADIDRAMQDGFSTGKSLGIGLPGARRLMDDFEIVSSVGSGTTVTMTKWQR